MLTRAVALIGVACVSACSVDYLDAETDDPVTDSGSGGAGGTAGAGGDCSTIAEDYTAGASPATDWVIGKFESNFWLALRFGANQNEVACGVGVMLNATGASVPGSLEVSIHEEAAGAPGTMIGPVSASVVADTISLDPTLVPFTGLSSNLEAGKSYFLVLHKDSSDENNHIVIRRTEAVVADGQSLSSEDGVNWSVNGWEQGLLKIFR